MESVRIGHESCARQKLVCRLRKARFRTVSWINPRRGTDGPTAASPFVLLRDLGCGDISPSWTQLIMRLRTSLQVRVRQVMEGKGAGARRRETDEGGRL